MQLAGWNELLLPARLQIREVSGVRSQLSLVSRTEPDIEDLPAKCVQEAWTCASGLLKSHPCIVTLELSLETLGNCKDLLLGALKDNSSVKNLKISEYPKKLRKDISKVLASMRALEKIEIENAKPSLELQSAISTVLRTTVSLRVLRINGLEPLRSASVLLNALFANGTLNELSFNESLLSSLGAAHRRAFEEYLEKSVTLTTFEFFGGKPWSFNESIFSTVLYGLVRNKTIRRLNIIRVTLGCESNRLLTQLLETKKCLRCFKLNLSSPHFVPRCCNRPDEHSSWMLAAAKSKTLEEVTLDIDICGAPKWRLFLVALSSNTSSMKVHIEAFGDSRNAMVDVCREIRERRIHDRVSFSTQVQVQNIEVLQCKALSEVSMCLEVGRNIEQWPLFAGAASL
ncbi:hypothetical protein HPB48_021421 [Haemaphysalis longicornis]|uniref:Uncharacterized protein n=1 Tax=Haemaphysalis longicornis TaxID=44386 RepID=A0A9J6FQ93_HAELO|nr:hypothetical protein HPB48_021421 [Haemaphysalis longicornis]